MKQNKNKLYLLLFLLAIIFTSCEDVIEIDLESSDPALVAEGVIEPGEPVWLQLSYTYDYFSEETTKYEEEAIVYLSDGNGNIDTLYYDGEGMYRGKQMLGEENTTYTISFNKQAEIYTASSHLLPAPEILNVWFEESSMTRPGEDEKNYEIHVEISNDIQQDNFYLFKFYVNGELEDDSYSITSSKYYPAEEYLEYHPFRIEFKLNDEVEVVVYRIDEDIYNYFNQLNDLTEDGPGGSSTPYNPQSNFGKGVMGYFSAWSYNTNETTVE